VSNHSPVKRTFKIMPRGWNGLKVLSKPQSITLASRADGAVKVRVRVPKKSGTYVVTADVDSKNMHFRNWLEALVRVE
jgi:hypothetical protein